MSVVDVIVVAIAVGMSGVGSARGWVQARIVNLEPPLLARLITAVMAFLLAVFGIALLVRGILEGEDIALAIAAGLVGLISLAPAACRRAASCASSRASPPPIRFHGAPSAEGPGPVARPIRRAQEASAPAADPGGTPAGPRRRTRLRRARRTAPA